MEGEGVTGLAIVRSLGRNGVPVFVLGINGQLNLAASSRYCNQQIALPYLDGKLLYDNLVAIARRLKTKPMLYFDNDKMMIALAPHAEALEGRFLLTSPLRDTLRLTDKRFQMDVARTAGLWVPKAWFPKTWAELEAIDITQGRKLLAKPSPIAYGTGKSPFKTVTSQNVGHLISLLKRRVTSPDGLIIQEYVEGADSQVYVSLCYRSVRTECCHVISGVKVRQYPPGAGVMAVGQIADCQTVRDMTVRLSSSLNYFGIISTEFKYSQQDDKYYFIEFNPRPGQFHSLGWKAGLDLPMMAYWDYIDHKNLTCVNLRQDTGHFWIYVKADIGSLIASRRFKNIKQFVRPYLKPKEWAVFATDDLAPWLKSAIDCALWLMGKLLSKLSRSIQRK